MMISMSEFLGILILVLFAFIFVQGVENSRLTNKLNVSKRQAAELSTQINDQNTALVNLHRADSVKDAQIKVAMDKAQKQRLQADKAAGKVMSQTVPKNCNLAMQWGASQAPKLALCWFDKC